MVLVQYSVARKAASPPPSKPPPSKRRASSSNALVDAIASREKADETIASAVIPNAVAVLGTGEDFEVVNAATERARREGREACDRLVAEDDSARRLDDEAERLRRLLAEANKRAEAALQNAPRTAADSFVVPRVVEP